MEARFLTMGWTLVPKGHFSNPNYNTLCDAIESIYGIDSKLSQQIMGNQFESFDFVLRVVDTTIVDLIKRCAGCALVTRS